MSADERQGQGVAERTDYEELRDKIIELFNPADDDEAELSILFRTLDGAFGVVEALPCTCDVPDGDPCGRCEVLGRFDNERLGR